MKVVILQCLAGTEYVRNPGEVHEYDEAEAASLIAAGIAEAFVEETPVVGGPQSDEGGPVKMTKKRK